MVQKKTIRKFIAFSSFLAGVGFVGFFDIFTNLGLDYPIFGFLKIRILLFFILVISGIITMRQEVI